MELRIKFAIGVALAGVVLPILVAQAQSEGEIASTTEATSTDEVAVEEQVAPAGPSAAEEASQGETEEEVGEVLGTETETGSAPEVFDIETGPIDASASSTASTTEPIIVEEPKQEPQPFVLQPVVNLAIDGAAISADIELQNLTCKACEKVMPELDVIAYYTEWYPNDGPVKDYSQASMHMMRQELMVADLANWQSRGMSWSAENVAPGHYYFVVEIDPENKEGAHRLYRSEFTL